MSQSDFQNFLLSFLWVSRLFLMSSALAFLKALVVLFLKSQSASRPIRLALSRVLSLSFISSSNSFVIHSSFNLLILNSFKGHIVSMACLI